MALARTFSVALVGVSGRLVTVEADVGRGLPGFTLVGLPDASLSESRDRVRAALLNSGEEWPARRITVSLSPASLPKGGSSFDLAVACALVLACQRIPASALEGTLLLGELGLDGGLRAVRGVLPATMTAAESGLSRVVVPAANAAEAALVPGIRVLGLPSLSGLLALLRGQQPAPRDFPHEGVGRFEAPGVARGAATAVQPPGDLRDVLGQSEGRHALEVAAAGAHNLFLLGPPGAGKTMLATRLPGLLPRLERGAALEVTAIHSIAGALKESAPLIENPPFQDPHHTASTAAIVGGGAGFPRPGAASLAHRGVLFLDEAPEFARSVLDALRQPLESGEIVVSRAGGVARYPARFTLVLAANPCPCGLGGGGLGGYIAASRCVCTAHARQRYLRRLSGPLLDRVDVRVAVRPAGRAVMRADARYVEPTSVVAARVAAARERQSLRLRGTPWTVNAEVPGPELRRRWPPASSVLERLERHQVVGNLTARGVDRVLRVCWTLADLAGRPSPSATDVDAAVALRLSAGEGGGM